MSPEGHITFRTHFNRALTHIFFVYIKYALIFRLALIRPIRPFCHNPVLV